MTNQPGVARGLYGIDDVARVHQYIAQRLAERGATSTFCSAYHPADAYAEEMRQTWKNEAVAVLDRLRACVHGAQDGSRLDGGELLQHGLQRGVVADVPEPRLPNSLARSPAPARGRR